MAAKNKVAEKFSAIPNKTREILRKNTEKFSATKSYGFDVSCVKSAAHSE